MGMFDSLYITCPHCNEPTEEQSKVGDCLLHSYTPDNCPAEILADIMENQRTYYTSCEHCYESIKLDLVFQPTVIVTKG